MYFRASPTCQKLQANAPGARGPGDIPAPAAVYVQADVTYFHCSQMLCMSLPLPLSLLLPVCLELRDNVPYPIKGLRVSAIDIYSRVRLRIIHCILYSVVR